MKTNKTKFAIKKQFMKEYSNKKFSLITVKEICKNTPVARTTFYSYFSSLSEVLEEVEDDILNGIIDITKNFSNWNHQNIDFIDFMNEIEKYIIDNKTYIKIFLVIQPNFSFINKWKEAIKTNFSKRYPNKISAKNYEAISEIMSSTIISMYTYWMGNFNKSSTKEMKSLLKNMLDTLIKSI